MASTHPVKPFLWYDQDAEEAAKYYVSIFGGEILKVHHFSKNAIQPEGRVLTVAFKIRGVEFVALNGGTTHQFTPAVSFSIQCDTQEEIDTCWDTMHNDGGKDLNCGWINDKWGLSWQIVPTQLPQILGGSDREGAGRATQAMYKMKKLNVAELKAAYDGK
jgi:predicted 3-demethylubiquinone-9 3-methyltransferase (glyoxalase superfamily)